MRYFSGYQVVSLKPQPTTWRTSGLLFVWSLPFDLSGLGGPSRSLAPASIALRVVTGHTNLPATIRRQLPGRPEHQYIPTKVRGITPQITKTFIAEKSFISIKINKTGTVRIT
jgi:hypothetical protein